MKFLFTRSCFLFALTSVCFTLADEIVDSTMDSIMGFLNETSDNLDAAVAEIDAMINATVEGIVESAEAIGNEIANSNLALCIGNDTALFEMNPELQIAYNMYWRSTSYLYTEKSDGLTGAEEYKGIISYGEDALAQYESVCNGIEGTIFAKADPTTYECTYNSNSSSVKITETNYAVCAPDVPECEALVYEYLGFESEMMGVYENFGIYCGRDPDHLDQENMATAATLLELTFPPTLVEVETTEVMNGTEEIVPAMVMDSTFTPSLPGVFDMVTSEPVVSVMNGTELMMDDSIPAMDDNMCEEDCVFPQYCASDGTCKEGGTCATTDDCNNIDNVYAVQMCMGTLTCIGQESGVDPGICYMMCDGAPTQCSEFTACANAGLEDDCCPTKDGTFLACCAGIETATTDMLIETAAGTTDMMEEEHHDSHDHNETDMMEEEHHDSQDHNETDMMEPEHHDSHDHDDHDHEGAEEGEGNADDFEMITDKVPEDDSGAFTPKTSSLASIALAVIASAVVHALN